MRKVLGIFLFLTAVTLFSGTMELAADDDLAPLIPIPDGPTDDLGPLVPLEDASDPSELEGHQMRPLSATVRVNQATGLEIKYCFSHTPEGGSEYIECNNQLLGQAELATLIPVVKSRKWSVNGIEGGNATVGWVKANGNQATYTAAAKVPKPATVAVSAEIDTEGGGKRLVNAEITIVESVIVSTVKFSGRREEHGEIIDYAGTADLDFVLADNFESGVRYDLNARSRDTRIVINKWNIRSDSLSCSLKQSVTQPSPDIPYSGNFFIYSTLNSYVFGTLIEMVGIVTCKDGSGESYDEEVLPRVLFTTSKGPPDLGLQPIAKDGKFTGKLTLKMSLDEDDEGSVTQTMEWMAQKF